MRMEYDGIPIPPCDSAIEPQGLGPGVMAESTLFSDSHYQLIAHVLNNSLQAKSLSMYSFLSMAELVQCLSGTSCHSTGLVFAESSGYCDAMLSDESALSALPSRQSATVSTDETDLRAYSVTATTSEVLFPDSSSPSSEEQVDHISSLLCNLPTDLTPEQRDGAERFIRSHANVFSRSEYDIGRTKIIPHRIDTGEHSLHFEQLRRHPTAQLPVIDEHVQYMLEHDVIEPAASPWSGSKTAPCVYALTIANQLSDC